jgi:hypothetical protein
MVEYAEKFLAFGQFIAIILIWIRFESRLSRLEGSFSMFCQMIEKQLHSVEKRH